MGGGKQRNASSHWEIFIFFFNIFKFFRHFVWSEGKKAIAMWTSTAADVAGTMRQRGADGEIGMREEKPKGGNRFCIDRFPVRRTCTAAIRAIVCQRQAKTSTKVCVCVWWTISGFYGADESKKRRQNAKSWTASALREYQIAQCTIVHSVQWPMNAGDHRFGCRRIMQRKVRRHVTCLLFVRRLLFSGQFQLLVNLIHFLHRNRNDGVWIRSSIQQYSVSLSLCLSVRFPHRLMASANNCTGLSWVISCHPRGFRHRQDDETGHGEGKQSHK